MYKLRIKQVTSIVPTSRTEVWIYKDTWQMSDVTDHICTVRDETGNWSVLLIESSFWLNVWQTLWRDLCVMTICGNIMLIIFLVQLLPCGKVLQFPSLDSMWIGSWKRASWRGMIQSWWSLFWDGISQSCGVLSRGAKVESSSSSSRQV